MLSQNDVIVDSKQDFIESQTQEPNNSNHETKKSTILKDYIVRFYRNSERFFHLLVGLPSYEKYLEYHKKYHPHCTPKNRKDFFLEVQNKRYSRDGSKKCC